MFAAGCEVMFVAARSQDAVTGCSDSARSPTRLDYFWNTVSEYFASSCQRSRCAFARWSGDDVTEDSRLSCEWPRNPPCRRVDRDVGQRVVKSFVASANFTSLVIGKYFESRQQRAATYSDFEIGTFSSILPSSTHAYPYWADYTWLALLAYRRLLRTSILPVLGLVGWTGLYIAMHAVGFAMQVPNTAATVDAVPLLLLSLCHGPSILGKRRHIHSALLSSSVCHGREPNHSYDFVEVRVRVGVVSIFVFSTASIQ